MRRIFFVLFSLWLVPVRGGYGEVASSNQAESLSGFQAIYQTGNYDEVIRRLETKESPTSQEALFLGLSYIQLGKQTEAIDAWRRYVRMEPGSEGARDISRFLTLLLQKEAKRTAIERLQQEKTFSPTLELNAIAVFPFTNLGKPEWEPLSKGLAEMIITDLSQVKTLKVVERIKIQAILNELKLSQSGLVDMTSAPRVGKLLGTGKMTTGSFVNLEEEGLRLNATVIQTESGNILTAPEATGASSAFFQLQKTLVFTILCGIGQCPESLDSTTKEAIEKVHTKNLTAIRLYAQGLDLLDQEKYREAARSFFLAVEEDPEFELARKALRETPLFPLDIEAIGTFVEVMDQLEGKSSLSGTIASPETIVIGQGEGAASVWSSFFEKEPIRQIVGPSTLQMIPQNINVPVSVNVNF